MSDIKMITAPQTVYKPMETVTPTYQYTRLNSTTSNQSSSFTLSPTTTSISEFEIPTRVHNMSRSKLRFTVTYSQPTAHLFRWADKIAPIAGVQLFSRQGRFFVDVQNYLPNYNSVALKKYTPLDKFLTKTASTGLTKSNTETFLNTSRVWQSSGTSSELKVYWANPSTTAATTSALGQAILSPGTQAATTINNRQNNVINFRADGTIPNQPYDEPKYFNMNSQTNTTVASQLTDTYDLDLGTLCRDSLLGVDKDIVFPEIVTLRIIWNSGVNIAFNTDDVNNVVSVQTAAGEVKFNYAYPSITSPADNPTAWGGTTTISKLQLLLAVETNEIIAESVQKQLKTEKGLVIYTPYLYIMKQNLQGSLQNWSQKFNIANGMTLLRITAIPYNYLETVNNTYYHSNDTNRSGGGQAITSFYTMLNNSRTTQFDIDCSNDTLDYTLMREKLDGSVYSSLDTYRYNWFWEDSWDTLKSADEKDALDTNVITGIDLTKEVKYDFVATCANSGSTNGLNWYFCAVFQRMLKITDKMIDLV